MSNVDRILARSRTRRARSSPVGYLSSRWRHPFAKHHKSIKVLRPAHRLPSSERPRLRDPRRTSDMSMGSVAGRRLMGARIITLPVVLAAVVGILATRDAQRDQESGGVVTATVTAI